MAAPQRSTPYFSISDNVEVYSCKAGKELQDMLLPKNQNPQGGSSKDVQTVAVARLIQSLEAISGAAWENLSSK